MNNNSKQYIIVGGVILVLIAAAVFVMTGIGKNNDGANEKETVFEKPTNVIPTVDSSVSVEVEGNKDATLTVKGVPDGTEEIEYELTYSTKSGSVEGVIGSITVDSGEDTVTEDFVFGTSSSGVTRYHEIVGKVKGTFKFSGQYGQKLLEKEFSV